MLSGLQEQGASVYARARGWSFPIIVGLVVMEMERDPDWEIIPTFD